MKNISEIRCKVATMANTIKKMGASSSEAFTKAWVIVKSGVSTKVKGVTFGISQKAIERLTHYNATEITVSLQREKANLYDDKAVAVEIGVKNKGIVKVGYLPCNLAKVISALMDKGKEVKAVYREIRGKYEHYMNYGLVIGINI